MAAVDLWAGTGRDVLRRRPNRRTRALRWLGGLAAAAVVASAGAAVVPVGPAHALTPVTVWLAGDSTMANDSGSGITGWGRRLGEFFGSDVTVQNKALAGRSIQTWMYEGGVSSTLTNGECALTSTTPSTRYQAVLDGMRSGDYLLIDFGINDGDPSCPRHVGESRYQQLMETLARQATAKGAHPILLTPTSGMSCSGSTAVANRGFGPQVRAAGSSTSSPVIELTSLSVALYNRLRLCPNNGDYTQGAVGDFFVDRTHFEYAGALQIAGLVAQAIADQRLPLAAYLKGTSSTTFSTSPTQSVGTPLVRAGLCLDAAGGARVSGAALVLVACTGSAQQWWTFSSAGELRTGDGSLCTDAYGKGTTPGTKVVLWACNGGANQQFGRDGDRIRGNASGLCVAPSGSAVEGAAVVLATCLTDGSQAWATAVVTTTTSSPTTTSPTVTSTSPTTTKTTKTTKSKTTKTKTTKTKSSKTKTTKTKKSRTRTKKATTRAAVAA